MTRLSRYGSRGLLFIISDSACSYANEIAGTWQSFRFKRHYDNRACISSPVHERMLKILQLSWLESIPIEKLLLLPWRSFVVEDEFDARPLELEVSPPRPGRAPPPRDESRGGGRSTRRDVETRKRKEEDAQRPLLTMSVPRSMQRMVTVPRGRGMSQRMNARKGEISGMFEVRVYAMDFFRLSKINRPSSTPVTIEAKLSSRRIMSAACLDTSEPAIPIATPMSAFFNAGESFTPSPAMFFPTFLDQQSRKDDTGRI